MTIDGAIEILTRAGFKVRPANTNEPWLTLFRIEGEQTDEMPFGPITVYKDACGIYAANGQWIFEKWDYAPGPGPDDVVFAADSLAAAGTICSFI